MLPVSNPTKSYWIQAASSPLRDHRSTPDLPATCDVLIIGSGYTGSAIAYWLSQFTNEPLSMVMLEARDVCGGATGRNGGQLKPHFYATYPSWSKQHGSTAALSLIHHEAAHLDAFSALLEKERISDECSFVRTTSWDALMSQVEIERSMAGYDALMEAEGEEAVKDVQLLRGIEEAEKVTRIKGCLMAIGSPAGQIWPYKFVHALLRILLAQGSLNLQSHTPALAMSEPDFEGYTSVTTNRGMIRAKRVIHATNRWTSHLLPEFENVITPVRGTLAAIKPSKAYLAEPFKPTCGQRWDGVINNYFLQLPPPHNTLIVGGAKQVLVENPTCYLANDEEDQQIPGVEAYYRAWPKRDLIGWDPERETELQGGIQGGGLWTGILTASADSMPFVGPVPRKQGHYVCAGFHGHGMPRILLSAAHLAPLVLESLDVQMMTPSLVKPYPPLPLPFKLTAERLDRLGAAGAGEKVAGALREAQSFAGADHGKLALGKEGKAMTALDSSWGDAQEALVSSAVKA